jgi:SSS family solute:Na+ symporter
LWGWLYTKRIYASKGEKKEKKGLLIAGFRVAHNMGVILGMLAKVAATNGMFEELQMLHRWIAKWDYLFY